MRTGSRRHRISTVFQVPGRRAGSLRIGRYTNFLDTTVVDRRYEKEGPNAMVLTSNIAPSGWDEFFTGDDTLLCALDRLFDKASVFVMRGPSYRGRELDTYSVEAVPQAVKVRGIQPEGM